MPANLSKVQDPRFWGRWAASGALKVPPFITLDLWRLQDLNDRIARGATVTLDPNTQKFSSARKKRNELNYLVGSTILGRSNHRGG